MACSGCQKLRCLAVLAVPHRASCELYRIMKTVGQGNFWWMVGGGEDGKKSIGKPFSWRGPIASSDHARAKKLFRSFFLLIFQEDNMNCTCARFHPQGSTVPHIGEPQSWAMGCAKNLLWLASPVAVSPALLFPTMPYHAIFSSFCPLWSLVLQPTSPQQPKRLSKVYVFFLALQFSLGDHPLSRGSKSGRVSHLKPNLFPVHT